MASNELVPLSGPSARELLSYPPHSYPGQLTDAEAEDREGEYPFEGAWKIRERSTHDAADGVGTAKPRRHPPGGVQGHSIERLLIALINVSIGPFMVATATIRSQSRIIA